MGRQILAAQHVKKIKFSLETSHKLLVGVRFESQFLLCLQTTAGGGS